MKLAILSRSLKAYITRRLKEAALGRGQDVKVLDMSVEDGAKLVISAGLVAPEYKATVKKIARRSHSKKT